MGHLAANCQGNAKRKSGEFDEKSEDVSVAKKPYQVWFIDIYVFLWFFVHHFLLLLYLNEMCSSLTFGLFENIWNMNSESLILLLKLTLSA